MSKSNQNQNGTSHITLIPFNIGPIFSIHSQFLPKVKAALAPQNSHSLLPAVDAIIARLTEKLGASALKRQRMARAPCVLGAREPFSLHLGYLAYYPASKDIDKIFFRAAIYHGADRLADEVDSSVIESEQIEEFHFLDFRQTLRFGARVGQLHRCAKLCLSLNAITKRRRYFILIFATIYTWYLKPDIFGSMRCNT